MVGGIRLSDPRRAQQKTHYEGGEELTLTRGKVRTARYEFYLRRMD